MNISIFKVEENEQKIGIMKKCDSAFPIGLFERKNCDEIVRKIVCNAFFYAAFRSYEGGLEPIGYNAFYANDYETKVAYISNIGVLDGFQRNHVGSELMRKCIEISKSEGMDILRLEVLKKNSKAIAFYTKWDFSFEGEGDGDTFYMSRRLNL